MPLFKFEAHRWQSIIILERTTELIELNASLQPDVGYKTKVSKVYFPSPALHF